MKRFRSLFLLFLLAGTRVAAQSVDFGNVQTGSSRDSSATVSNPLPLTVSVSSTQMLHSPSDFSIIAGGAPVNIPPNASHSVVIRFSPSALGLRTDTLVISGSFPGSPLYVGLYGTGIPLPVELSAFSAVWTQSGVALAWRTESERNNAGFHVQHEHEGVFHDIGFVKGNGTTDIRTEYSFIDAGPFAAGIEAYRLLQVDTDGTTELSSVLRVATGDVAQPSLQLRVLPQPARDVLTLRYIAPVGGDTRVTLADLLGRTVRSTYDVFETPGHRTASFDTGDLPAGTYVLTVALNGTIERRTVILAR